GCRVLLENNTIINMINSGIYAPGTRFDFGSELVILNNTILNCGEALNIWKGTARIGGNIISNSESGIFIGDQVGIMSIYSNIISNNLFYGIESRGGGTITINGNMITGNKRSGIHFHSDANFTIIDNIIANNTGNGIFMDGSYSELNTYNSTLSSNHISGSKYGISFDGYFSQEIIGYEINDIENCEYGLYIIEGSSPKISNVAIVNATYGICIIGDWDVSEKHPELMNITISNSITAVFVYHSQLTIDDSMVNSINYDFYITGISVVYVSNTSFDENEIFLEHTGDRFILPDREIRGRYPTSSIQTATEAQGYMTHALIIIIGFVLVPTVFVSTEYGKYRFLLFILPLYTRLKKGEILDQYTRGKIHGYIIANPGDHYTVIKKKLNLKNGTLAYHLHVLERENFIKSNRDGIYKRFYPAGMDKPEIEKIEANQHKLNRKQRKLLQMIREKPGISQKELVLLSRIKQPTVNYNIRFLLEEDIIFSQKDGRETRYYIKSRKTPDEEKVLRCKHCNSEIDTTWKACPICGEKI
ncbi:MAG: right-handed parallel beta-helix repeat-containing protein, partial [Methanomassiliicoccales archaeon]